MKGLINVITLMNEGFFEIYGESIKELAAELYEKGWRNTENDKEELRTEYGMTEDVLDYVMDALSVMEEAEEGGLENE